MRILLLTPQFPYPPEQGTSLRNYYILRGLTSDHEVSLLSYVESNIDRQNLVDLPGVSLIGTVPIPIRSNERRFLQLIAKKQADMALRLRHGEFEDLLTQELVSASEMDGNRKPYDIVQIEGIELAHLIPTIKQFSPQSKIVYDAHNAETNLQRRALQADTSRPSRWPAAVYSWIQVRRLNIYEAWVCQKADLLTVVSNEDYHHLRELVPGLQATVIPNCIDVEEYRRDSNGGDSGRDKEFDLLFTGKMDYRPNIDAVLWFAHEVWPIIRQARPETTWAIVGQKPHNRIKHLSKFEGVKITGWVPEIPPYMNASKVYVMPFRVGSGTRFKLIEAMAAGKAVVSTSLGCEGFSLIDRQDLLIEDEPPEFAQAVVRLLEQPEERSRLGQAALRRAADYDWRVVIPKFEDVYRVLLNPNIQEERPESA